MTQRTRLDRCLSLTTQNCSIHKAILVSTDTRELCKGKCLPKTHRKRCDRSLQRQINMKTGMGTSSQDRLIYLLDRVNSRQEVLRWIGSQMSQSWSKERAASLDISHLTSAVSSKLSKMHLTISTEMDQATSTTSLIQTTRWRRRVRTVSSKNHQGPISTLKTLISANREPN